ncbi:MAG: hypothetical protein QM541_03765 [Flavobacterium sp.]|nr:hypothetical protein [Flavobacterium sp.]
MATVAATLYTFIVNHPVATIIATGSTQAKTRLYRMGITNNLKAIEKDFIILGYTETSWKPLRKNITYGAFLVRRKLEIMKTKAIADKKKLPKSFKVNTTLDEYTN